MKKVKIKLDHWLCKGIYVRTKNTFSTLRHKYDQLNAGFAFKADEIIQSRHSFQIRDEEGVIHNIQDIRPAKKSEREKFLSKIHNPNRKPIHIYNN